MENIKFVGCLNEFSSGVVEIKPRKLYRYNLKRERVAQNHVHNFGIHTLPKIVDLRLKCPPICSQGNLGSCTSFALASAFQYLDPKWNGSHLFLYYNERMLDNPYNITDDSGSTISQGIVALKKFGICKETSWPYDVEKFATKPPNSCYVEGKLHQVINAIPIAQTQNAMKQCLASNFPIALGIAVYESFESDEVAKTGIVPMPKETEQLLGFHAVLLVGYDDSKKVWIMRNSWGDWGMKGYFTLDYAYLNSTNLASDLWSIRKEEVV